VNNRADNLFRGSWRCRTEPAALTHWGSERANDTGFTGSLGAVAFDGQGTITLSFDVSLNANVFCQMQEDGLVKTTPGST
jgi:hypothetical protein